MKAHFLLPLCLFMTACGTPQEQCISRETRDYRIVQRLIDESERNIARGYAIEQVTVYRDRWKDCGGAIHPATRDRGRVYRPRLCLDTERRTVSRPKAIDLAAEARNLEQLRVKRSQLQGRAEQSIAACRKLYPEES